VWLALVACGVLLSFAAALTPLLPGDLLLAREFQEARALDALITPAMVAISLPGYEPWAELLYASAVLIPLMARRWSMAALLALTLTGDAMAQLVKLIVARARPTTDLVEVYRQVAGASFPSGHVVHYVVFFGVIGYLAWLSLRSQPAGTPWRIAMIALLVACGGLILLIGPSRVYLGAHWPTDALGGYLLGSAWLWLLVAAYERWRHQHPTANAPGRAAHG
jgi:membrane-associated phospholipid phosphatase